MGYAYLLTFHAPSVWSTLKKALKLFPVSLSSCDFGPHSAFLVLSVEREWKFRIMQQNRVRIKMKSSGHIHTPNPNSKTSRLWWFSYVVYAFLQPNLFIRTLGITYLLSFKLDLPLGLFKLESHGTELPGEWRVMILPRPKKTVTTGPTGSMMPHCSFCLLFSGS